MVKFRVFISWLTTTLLLVEIMSYKLRDETINTRQKLCNGTFPHYTNDLNAKNITIDKNAPSIFLSCDQGNPSLSVYWFWVEDVCRSNTTDDRYFAYVNPSNISTCINSSRVNITKVSCENNFEFDRRSIMIRNASESISGAYICILAQSAASMDYSTAIIYNIKVVDPSITTTTSVIATTTPESCSDCWLVLKIVIPCVVGGILLILLIVGIVCYCRRRKSNPKKDKSDVYHLRDVQTTSDQAVNERRPHVNGNRSYRLENSRNSDVWQPVEDNF